MFGRATIRLGIGSHSSFILVFQNCLILIVLLIYYIRTYSFLWVVILISTRMWANAERDGRPAEYRWRPLFNAAKFG